ncbi:uncharacterized protein LODBEIA_P56590 [Lodderomyces beijingensis]|uniref:Inositol polyphosphate-related phosphatase domain-containing protein n=1 Tax=Lodderomyces beijingensis TaxID=1775926 RepID=A0ABP0ZVM1_9ASCO
MTSQPPQPIESGNQIPLFLFTYNCNKRRFIPGVFQSKLLEVLPDQLCTLYVFGFQEFCTILDSSFPADAHCQLIEMNQLLQEALEEKYQLPSSIHTVSMHMMGSIAMIIVTPFASKVGTVRNASSSCGYMYSSLKGGVGTRLAFYPNGRYDSSGSVELSFATLHLNAHEGEYYYLQRNQNLHRIIRSLDFGDGYGLVKPKNHIFILGDLNYRTTKQYNPKSPQSQELLSLMDTSLKANKKGYRQKVEKLVKEYDEFRVSMRNGEVLQNFAEPKITFPPTYKYHVNTAIFNSKRSPSWCDRIVYLSTYEELGHDNLGLTLLKFPGKNSNPEWYQRYLPHTIKYDSIETLLQSDHRPVYLNMTIPFQPPESILSSLSGCLQILPQGITGEERFDNASQLETLAMSTDVVSGPTTIYLKPTSLDFIQQQLLRPTSDTIIGYSLWLTHTPKGRVYLFAILLIVSLGYFFI